MLFGLKCNKLVVNVIVDILILLFQSLLERKLLNYVTGAGFEP